VTEPGVSATGIVTNDPDALLSGTVVAGRPTFTG
jgi:hypothetical protein